MTVSIDKKKTPWDLIKAKPEEWAAGTTAVEKFKWIASAKKQLKREIDALLGENVVGLPLLKRDYSEETQDEMTASNTCNFCTFSVCCRHVTLPIDEPNTRRAFSDYLWAVAHTGLALYVSDTGDWFVNFKATCNFLMPGGGCSIYETRPMICREFSNDSCEFQKDHPRQMGEYNLEQFDTYSSLLAYCKRRFPMWDDPEWDGVIGGYVSDGDESDDDGPQQTVLSFSNSVLMRRAAGKLHEADITHSIMDGWGGLELEVPTEDEGDLEEIRRLLHTINFAERT